MPKVHIRTLYCSTSETIHICYQNPLVWKTKQVINFNLTANKMTQRRILCHVYSSFSQYTIIDVIRQKQPLIGGDKTAFDFWAVRELLFVLKGYFIALWKNAEIIQKFLEFITVRRPNGLSRITSGETRHFRVGSYGEHVECHWYRSRVWTHPGGGSRGKVPAQGSEHLFVFTHANWIHKNVCWCTLQ